MEVSGKKLDIVGSDEVKSCHSSASKRASEYQAIEGTATKTANRSATDMLPQCTKHKNEEVNLYCRAHEIFGCCICMMLSHSHCEKDYIPEVSENYVKNVEFLNLQKTLDDLNGKCAAQVKRIEADMLGVTETCLKLVSSVKERKKKILTSLDKFEKELEGSIANYRKKNMEILHSLKNNYEKVSKEVTETKSTIVSLMTEKKYNALFHEVKEGTAKILGCQSKMYEIATFHSIPQSMFRQNDEFLTKENLFGSIEIKETELGPCNSPELVKRDTVSRINIKSENDRKVCYATGLAFLSTDQLAVADKANKSVKIIDVTYDKIISDIGLSSSPRDITVIPPNQLAVTLRDEKKIQLLSTASGLEKSGEIKSGKYCRGIKYDNNMLYVTYDNLTALYNVRILDMQGQILKRVFDPGFLMQPKCLGLSPSHKHIYVTDYGRRTLYRISDKDTVESLETKGIFVGLDINNSGTVYATYENAVVQCTDDLSKCSVVLDARDGIACPIALVIAKTTNMLYVSCGNGEAVTSNYLHVFKIR